MRARSVAVSVAVVLAGLAPAAWAEVFGVGSRVRVAGLGVPHGAGEATILGQVTGRVLAMDDGTLLVQRADGSRVAFRQDGLRLLQTSSGPRSQVRGALRGGLIAGTFGAGVGLLYHSAAWEFVSPGDSAAAVKYFALRAALVGLVVGALAPGEHWSHVEIGRARVQIAPTAGPRGRGAGLAVSVGF